MNQQQSTVQNKSPGDDLTSADVNNIVGTLNNNAIGVTNLHSTLSAAINAIDLESITNTGGVITNDITTTGTLQSASISGDSLYVDDIYENGQLVKIATVSNIISDTGIGGISPLDTISSGTSLQEFAELLLYKTYYPTYTSPAASLASGIAASVEVGTTGLALNVGFNPGSINGNISSGIWSPNLKQDDRAGNVLQYTYSGDTISSTSQPGNTLTLPSTVIESDANVFNAVVNYAPGPQPLDSKGESFETPLPTGTVNRSVIVNGRRNAFYGTDLASTDSAGIRLLSNNKLNPVNGTTFTINIEPGSANVVFAYPANLRNVNSVKHVQGLNAEIKGIFTQQAMSVEGANGYTAVNYKVYSFTPLSPYADTATYTVTI
jgi:hypothetical protein